jgi:DNA-binding GntR family transcriptional regulator
VADKRFDNLQSINVRTAKPGRSLSARAVLVPATTLANSEHAVNEVRQAIVTGRLRPGQRLVEVQLAAQLRLSRGPVREALQQLSREGLVELRTNRGAIVASIHPEDVLEVYAIRASLGALALRHLIRGGRINQNLVVDLQQLAQRARQAAGKRNQNELVSADLELQTAIAEASGLKRVASQFRSLSSELQMFVSALQVHYSDEDLILREHDQLIDAIRAQDLQRAEHVWRTRFRRSIDEFLDRLPGGPSEAEKAPWLVSAVEDDGQPLTERGPSTRTVVTAVRGRAKGSRGKTP